MRWRLLLSSPLDGPDNMALDEALMALTRRSGETVARVYSWSSPTLSLGRNQRALGAYDLGALAERGVNVVRRPTGGRGLLHNREVTYSITAPADDRASLVQSYADLNQLLINALGRLGVPATIASGERRTSPPTSLPCFAEAATGEITAGGRKLAGSAQWRHAGALLQHGSVLVDDDQGMLPELMISDATSEPVPPPATLRALLERAVEPAEFAAALFAAVREMHDASASALVLDAATNRDAAALAPRYRDSRWTWRR